MLGLTSLYPFPQRSWYCAVPCLMPEKHCFIYFGYLFFPRYAAAVEGWDAEGDGRETHAEGDMCIPWMISADTWQRLTHYCISIVLQ